MYKIFLCLRYLRSKVFAAFGMLCVALAVCLMLICVSVFTGFLNKIEHAAKGLFGDIVVEPNTSRGMEHYDEFIAKIKSEVPEVEAAGPFILSLGMITVKEYTDYWQFVQIAGIRLPGRADETDFEQGLFVQRNNPKPTFDPSTKVILNAIKGQREEMKRIMQRDLESELAALPAKKRDYILNDFGTLDFNPIFNPKYIFRQAKLSAQQEELLRQMSLADTVQSNAISNMYRGPHATERLAALRDSLAEDEKRGAGPAELDTLKESIEQLEETLPIEPASHHIILGLGIRGLSFRTEEAETVRIFVPGNSVALYVYPLGKARDFSKLATPSIAKFTIVDDFKSDVSSIDKQLVYIPFDTLQKMNNMGPEISPETGEVIVPGRCNQIHIKVYDEFTSREKLPAVATKIRECWSKFIKQYPNAAGGVGVDIATWRVRQRHVIEPLESQRILVMIVVGIIWIVVAVLIFVIFYTIVVQKTKDIGVMKTLGASSFGVAQIFLVYGAMIGLVGSI
ncbi:MAG: hypothetical protein KAR11_09205, partial [Phycisphaerae bacterium]|nr:hypothetical protein [Phycisphaerae bacterium]